MENEFWQRAKALSEKALTIEPTQRLDWLRKASEYNTALFNEARALLQSDDPPTHEVFNKMGAKDTLSKNESVTSSLQDEGERPLVRRVFGQWRAIRTLGSGGMGSIWLVERIDQSFKMQAALKLLKTSAGNPEFTERFKRERQILANLKHPNIGHLLDGGVTEDGQQYLVMEYVEGLTIDAYIKKHNLSRSEILLLFRQLCLACAYAHRNGVLHRDLKPRNVLVTWEGFVKLVDFGIAALEDGSNLTRERISPMTPEYASPERFVGIPITAAADMYSLGLILLYLYTGSEPKTMRRDPLGFFTKWQKVNGANPDLERFLTPILDKVPTLRPKSMDAVLVALDDLINSDKELTSEDGYGYEFHAFLWGSHQDFQEIEPLALRLESEYDLHVWHEAWHVVPGEQISEAISGGISKSRALVVFVGQDFPWRNEFLNDQFLNKLNLPERIIPVALPGYHAIPEEALPLYLRHRSWVNLKDPHCSLEVLVRAIRGMPGGRRHEQENQKVQPYHSPEPFSEADAPYFFGRETVTKALVDHLKEHQTCIITGPSACGKTSLINAGIKPKLREAGYQIAALTPGNRPLEELAFALVEFIGKQGSVARLERAMNDHPSALLDTIESTVKKPLLIVIDQLERIFAPDKIKVEVNRFLENLQNLLEANNSRHMLVFALRSDHLPQFTQTALYKNCLAQHRHTLDLLNREQLLSAISKPAKLCGFGFETGLVGRLIPDIAQSPGQLSLLGQALVTLHENRRGALLTTATYTEINGVEGALAQDAETLFLRFEKEDQERLKKLVLFAFLSPTQGGFRFTSRQVSRSELMFLDHNKSRLSLLLDQLVESRILISSVDMNESESLYELAHPDLLQTWGRALQWIVTHRNAAFHYALIRRQAAAWHQGGQHHDFLARGQQLAQNERWLENEGSPLIGLVENFLKASRAAQKREILHKRIGIGLLAIAVIGNVIQWL